MSQSGNERYKAQNNNAKFNKTPNNNGKSADDNDTTTNHNNSRVFNSGVLYLRDVQTPMNPEWLGVEGSVRAETQMAKREILLWLEVHMYI